MKYSFTTKAYGVGSIALVALFMIAAGFGAFTSTGAVDATGGGDIYPTPTCPYTAQAGRTIVTFGNDRLLANNSAQHQTRPQSVTLPAGEYEVRMASYDGYSDRAETDVATQTREQWKGVLRNGNIVVAETGMLNDLKDGVNEASLRGVVNESLVLSQDVTTVIGVHAFAPRDTPDSVAPTCLVFDAKGTTSAPAPTTEVKNFTTFDPIKPISDIDPIRQDFKEFDPIKNPAPIDQNFGSFDPVKPISDIDPIKPIVFTYSTSCPIPAKPGRTIVQFTDERIRSDKTAADSVTTVKPVSLPAGTYTVTLSGTDGYEGRETVSQPNERWKMAFKNDHTVVAYSNGTTDLADNIRTTVTTEVVNQKLVLGQSVNGVQGVHMVFPDKTSPNSLNPTCASFDKINETPTPKPDPTPEVPQSPVCPLQPQAGRTIITFSDRLRSDQQESQAKTAAQSVSLPKGTYSVTLVSWDGYIGRENVTQPHEQWKVVLRNNNGYITHTAAIKDVPDKVREATVVDEVHTNNFVLYEQVNSVTAMHAFYPDTTSPNSVNPICAAFDKITETPTPKPAPVCTMAVSNQNIEKGASVTLSWTGENVSAVSIDQGIGSVIKNDSKVVSPATTTTYSGTFVGINGDTITCNATVTVKPVSNPQQPPQSPACPLQPQDGRTIIDFTGRIRSDQGDSQSKTNTQSVSLPKGTYSVTLVSWDGYIGRENVTQPHEQWKVVLRNNNGYITHTAAIKDVPDKVREATVVDEVHTNNFVLYEQVNSVTAMHAFYPDTTSPNSVNPICAAFDKKKEEQKPAPVCEMKIADQIIDRGATTTLSWTGENVSAVSIDQGIGSVIKNDSKVVSPATTTTYTGTFVGINGDTITCNATVTVKQPETPHAPICALSVSPSSIRSTTEEVTLTWSSQNVTSASIDQGVGSVATSGSQKVTPSVAKTYTGTFVGKNNETITCSASVTVVRGGGGGGPCLNCGGGGGGGGGGSTSNPRPKPQIEVANEIIRATPGSFIYLDQVPYTGFEAGPFVTALFWLGLLVLSAGISYLIVVKRIFSTMLQSVAGTPKDHNEWNAYEATRVSTPHVPDNRFPTARNDQVRASVAMAPSTMTSAYAFHASITDDEYADDVPSEERVEDRAQRDSILFSPEALHTVASRVSIEGDDYLETLIENAKETFPREDGWILLSMERIKKLVEGNATPAPTDVAPAKAPRANGLATNGSAFRRVAASVTDTPRVDSSSREQVRVPIEREAQAPSLSTQNAASPAQARASSTANGFGSHDVTAFVAWLSENNQQEAFEFLRKLSSQGHSAEQFVSTVVRELDEVYKNRIEGDRTPNMTLVKETAVWSNGDFERVLGMLVESVDYSYQSSRVGTKVALAKVFEFFASKNAKQGNR